MEQMNKGLTVAQLFLECKRQIAKGNGNKHILISDDDEGNGFHTLFYGIADDPGAIWGALEIEHDHHSVNEVVVLG